MSELLKPYVAGRQRVDMCPTALAPMASRLEYGEDGGSKRKRDAQNDFLDGAYGAASFERSRPVREKRKSSGPAPCCRVKLPPCVLPVACTTLTRDFATFRNRLKPTTLQWSESESGRTRLGESWSGGNYGSRQ